MSKKLLRLLFIFVLVLVKPSITAAQTPQFIFPAACTYGKDCWAVNYVDVDSVPEKKSDFKCNAKTYDAHKGTDFALGSIAQMNKGVDVIAAAAGTVLRFRDGESDTLKSEEDLNDIRSNTKECGNGVLLDHGNGLQTIYCHLKKDSIIVKAKDKVTAGQKLAQIGQSGMAEFPHLHFGVTWEGGIIDPYTGLLSTDGCGKTKQPLWAAGLPMPYEAVAIFDGGFASKPPDFKGIQRGEPNPDTLPQKSAAFVFWAGFYNVEQGDQVILQILDPDGAEFNRREEIVPQTRARQYYFTGRKIGDVQLKTGTYKGISTIMRGAKNGAEAITKTKEFTITVTP